MNNTKQISSRVNPVCDERQIAGRERFICTANLVQKGLKDLARGFTPGYRLKNVHPNGAAEPALAQPSDGFTFAALAAFTAFAALIHAPVDIAVAFLALRSERINIDPRGIFLSGITILIRSVPGVNGQAIH